MQILQPPVSAEYGSVYAPYIASVPEGAFEPLLQAQIGLLQRMGAALTSDQGRYRPAPDAWSVNEVIGHICDVERVLLYRAVAVARKDSGPLGSFDQEAYVREAGYDARPILDLVAEFAALRTATLHTFGHAEAAVFDRRRDINGNIMSVRALLYVMVGHVYYHYASLTDEYFGAMGLGLADTPV